MHAWCLSLACPAWPHYTSSFKIIAQCLYDVYPWQAWLDLTHLSRKRILTALDAFLALMEPHNKAVIRSIQVLSVISKRDVKSTFIQTSQPFDIDNLLTIIFQDPAAVIAQKDAVKLAQLRSNPFARFKHSLDFKISSCWWFFLPDWNNLNALPFEISPFQFSPTCHQPLNTHQPLNRRICQVFAEDAEVVPLNRQIVDRRAGTILPCSFILDDHTHIRCWLLRSF